MDLIIRSAVWLTVRESRASFLIEHEQDKEDRIRRFAAVMESEVRPACQSVRWATETLVALQRGIHGESATRYGIRRSPVWGGLRRALEPVWKSVPLPPAPVKKCDACSSNTSRSTKAGG